MNTLEIDLTGYDTGYKSGYNRHWTNSKANAAPITDWELTDRDEGRRAAKDSNIVKLAPDADEIIIRVPDRVQSVDESFLKLFLGPTARKMGPGALKKKLTIAGGTGLISRYSHMHINLQPDVSWPFDYYFREEQKRIDARVKKSARSTASAEWSDPKALFVPDIGTKLRLTIPWRFDLYYERRNDKLLELVTGKEQRYGYDSYGKLAGVVTVQPDAVLIVDRVYIRQGSGFEDFSSLTFRMEKGAEIEFSGRSYTTTTSHRFWAKLRHVNAILAEMDLNSLPGQEKEGTARK